jgi:hypothetical protein
MTPLECSREKELVRLLVSGRYPESCSDELGLHIEGCGICKDVVTAGLAIREAQTASVENAPVPPPGLVWWRAELRARREAARAAERPITVAQALAAASTIGVALALLAGMLPMFRELLGGFTSLPELGPLAIALAVIVLATPVALYFVFSDK